MTQLAVVIVSWNTKELTRSCLHSLYKDIKSLDNEVWVVDNNSTDGSIEMIKEKFPQVKLIENQDNVGFAKANNQALKKADADYYLLLNSDTVIPENAISSLFRYLDENKDIDAAGPRLTDGKNIQHSFTKLPSIFGEIKYCLVYHFFPFGKLFRGLFFKSGKYLKSLDKPLVVELLSAACLLLRRDLIENVGYLSEDYFLFSEENDYFNRMKRAGKKSVYLPNIELIHLIGKSREKSIKIDSEKNFLRSRLLYFRKFHPGSLFFFKLIYYLFFGWSYIFGLLSKLIKGNDKYKMLYGTLLRTLGDKD